MGKAKINYRLYASLLVMGLCPAIYQAVRIFFLGQMPDPGAYSIAGQLSWVQLLYEIVQETVLLPLYFFLGQVVSDNVSFGNRVRSGLWLTAGIWTALAVAVSAFARPLLGWMAAAPDIIEASATYIRIESFANIFATLFSFALVALVTLGREKWLYAITGARLVLSILLDCLFFSNLPFSLRLGVNGIGWSNLAANGILFVVALALLAREGVPLGGKLSFGWAREFFQVSSLSGLESFVRNFAYMAMVVRMVNVVQEQGLYWTANNFIWGWLLLPVTQLGELVKRDVATNAGRLRQKVRNYAVMTAGICCVWVVSIPLWKPFMSGILGYADTDRLVQLVLLLLGFYVVFAFQNIIHAVFFGLGKTNYLLVQSVVTNAVYYGGAFLLYRADIWVPTLNGIALLFGWWMVFGAGVTAVLYWWLLRSRRQLAAA